MKVAFSIPDSRLPTFKSEEERQKAPREERLYTKLFNLFGLVGYFCRAVLEGEEEAFLSVQITELIG